MTPQKFFSQHRLLFWTSGLFVQVPTWISIWTLGISSITFLKTKVLISSPSCHLPPKNLFCLQSSPSQLMSDLVAHTENLDVTLDSSLSLTPSIQSVRESCSLYLQNIFSHRNFCSWKDTVREWKDKAQTGGKYLEIIYLIKDLCPEYIKNS